MQILSRDVNMGGANGALQVLPEVFQSVDVRVVQSVFLRAVIDRLVGESFFVQSFVGAQLVSVNRGALFNIRLNNRLQSFLANIRDNFRHHLPVALQHSKHNRLVSGVAASHSFCPATDIGFIALNLARQRKLAVHFRHVLADLMADAKRAFIGYAKLPLQFFSRNAMA